MLKDLFRKRFSELTEGESAEDISTKTHFTQKYAKDFLKGERCPDIFDLCRIADAYNVTTDYLLGRTEEKEPAPAAAGQAHKEISNTNNIAQSEEVVKNFTDFLPILLEFARQYFGDINVQHISAHDDVNSDSQSVDIEFVSGDGYRYRILLESIETEEEQP